MVARWKEPWQFRQLSTYTYTHIYIYIYICTYRYTLYILIIYNYKYYTHTYIYICTCVCMHIYIYIYACICPCPFLVGVVTHQLLSWSNSIGIISMMRVFKGLTPLSLTSKAVLEDRRLKWTMHLYMHASDVHAYTHAQSMHGTWLHMIPQLYDHVLQNKPALSSSF